MLTSPHTFHSAPPSGPAPPAPAASPKKSSNHIPNPRSRASTPNCTSTTETQHGCQNPPRALRPQESSVLQHCRRASTVSPLRFSPYLLFYSLPPAPITAIRTMLIGIMRTGQHGIASPLKSWAPMTLFPNHPRMAMASRSKTSSSTLRGLGIGSVLVRSQVILRGGF